MEAKYILKNGLVQKSKETILGGFELNRFVKWLLGKINVAYADPCCLEGQVNFPVTIPAAAQNDIAAGTGGAISVVNYFTTINSDAGGDAFTLADGTQIGQLKKIRLVDDGGGDAVVTPANLAGGTTITFDDAADEVELIWNGTDWVVIYNVGATVA
jgi:hypothetical protein